MTQDSTKLVRYKEAKDILSVFSVEDIGHAITILESSLRMQKSRPPRTRAPILNRVFTSEFVKNHLPKGLEVLRSIHFCITANDEDAISRRKQDIRDRCNQYEIINQTICTPYKYPVIAMKETLERVLQARENTRKKSKIIIQYSPTKGLVLKDNYKYQYPVRGKRKEIVELLLREQIDDNKLSTDVYTISDLFETIDTEYNIPEAIREINSNFKNKLALDDADEFIVSFGSSAGYSLNTEKFKVEKVER